MKGSCDPLLKKSTKKMAKERRHHHMPTPDESNREEQVVARKRRKEKRNKKMEGVTVDARSSKEDLLEVDNRRRRWGKKEKKRKPKQEELEVEQAVRRNKRPKSDDEVVGLTPVGVEGVMVVAGSSKVELAEVDNRREKEEKKKKRKPAEEEQAVRKSKRSKPDDEVVGLTLVDAGSFGKRRKKVVRWMLSRKLLKYLRGREVMGHFAVGMPPIDPKIPRLFFDQQLREEIISEFEENKEFDAYVLFQYRTKGYAEIQEEVSDNEGEGDDYEIRYFVSEDENKIKDKNKDQEQSSIAEGKDKDQEQGSIAEGKGKNKIKSAAIAKGKDKNKIKSRAPSTM
ncbi:hypothetical protein BS78_05G253100 [Paspalum vaginatum]|nr:hypothetical protein BS78_05G253100 [Paspalum vaginatum]